MIKTQPLKFINAIDVVDDVPGRTGRLSLAEMQADNSRHQ
jgi:hypothetical protein